MSKCIEVHENCPNILCDSPLTLNVDTCECECETPVTCDPGFKLENCQCVCDNPQDVICPSDTLVDQNCNCNCSKECDLGFSLVDCECVCNTTCSNLQTLNPTTCQCECNVNCGNICLELNTNTCECLPIQDCCTGYIETSGTIEWNCGTILNSFRAFVNENECSVELEGDQIFGGVITANITCCNDITGTQSFNLNQLCDCGELSPCQTCNEQTGEITGCSNDECCNPVTSQCIVIDSDCTVNGKSGKINNNCDCIESTFTPSGTRNPIGTSCGDPNVSDYIKTGPGCWYIIDGTVNHCWGEDTIRNVFTCCDPTTNMRCNCC